MKKGILVLLIVGLLLGLLAVVGCSSEAGPAGPVGPAGPAGMAATDDCADCHNDTTLVSSKAAQAALTTHQTGRGWHYAGPRAACTNCHASEGFTAMVAEGKGIEDGEDIADASPPNCRTCHEIHTTYTSDDWALTTTEPVTLIAGGAVYDQGNGNLCANCHQPRREMAVDENGMVNVSSTHWGPHHGPQAAVLLGVVGWGAEGKPGAHYTMVENGCPTCHLNDDSHLFSPSLDRGAINACTPCHADATNFDVNGLQTEVDELLAELKELLEAEGLYHDHPVVGIYPEAKAGALWNYIMIEIEDASSGVHNPSYTKALLNASIDALK